MTSTGVPPDRRTTILERALELFARQGYAGTGMRAIARAAGIREATLYHYFPTKEELMNAVVEHYLTPREVFFQLMPRDLPVRDLHHGAAMGFLGAMRQPANQQFVRMMLTEAHHHDAWARRYREELYQPPADALADALARAGARHARWVAKSFSDALLSYVIHEQFLNPDGRDESEHAGYIAWLVDQAVRSAME